MRKLALAVLASLSAFTAVPAMADSAYPYRPYQDRPWDRDRDVQNDRPDSHPYDGRYGDNDRGLGYDVRKPGWRDTWSDNRGYLPPHRLIRRVQRQGYYDVRPMGVSRRGLIRAMAYDQWQRPVSLRIDPYTGRVVRVMAY
jgi:hypothetical protein